VNVSYPASIAAGDLLVICFGNKYPTNGPATPADWTLVTGGQGTGGAGAPGVDSGDVYATVFVTVATGSESGSQTVSVASGNSSTAFMARYTKTAATWAYAASNGAENSQDTTWGVTATADPGVASGDMVITCSARNVDGNGFSANAISQTGVTYAAMNERADNGTSFGDDVAVVVADAAATAGTSSAAPLYTATVAGAGAAGATVFLRIRETSSATRPCVIGGGMLCGGHE
jgi:MSHA biogenesis protein MshQ